MTFCVAVASFLLRLSRNAHPTQAPVLAVSAGPTLLLWGHRGTSINARPTRYNASSFVRFSTGSTKGCHRKQKTTRLHKLLVRFLLGELQTGQGLFGACCFAIKVLHQANPLSKDNDELENKGFGCGGRDHKLGTRDTRECLIVYQVGCAARGNLADVYRFSNIDSIVVKNLKKDLQQ